MDDGDVLRRPAAAPDADLACEFGIAREAAGARGDLAAALIGHIRRVDGGIEAHFRESAWGDVARYIEIESHCCPYLNLEARREGDAVVLQVTGRREAQAVIEATFGLEADADNEEGHTS